MTFIGHLSEAITALKLAEDDRSTRGVAKAQGVENIFQMPNITPEGLDVDTEGEKECNKDTGLKARYSICKYI